MKHFVSGTCNGVVCKCGKPATHKVGEEIPYDDPDRIKRHNFTTYVCCECFGKLFGSAVLCFHTWNTAQWDTANTEIRRT